MKFLIELGALGALFAILFGVLSVLLSGAMAHTNSMISGIEAYSANPTDENRQALNIQIEDSNGYLKDITSVSSGMLSSYLDAINPDVLSESEKQSIIRTKEGSRRHRKKRTNGPGRNTVEERAYSLSC